MATLAELEARVTIVERVATDAASRVKSNDAAVRGLVTRGGVVGPTGATGADGDDGPALATILAAVYPVGAIYISTNSTDPATSLGFGTWAAFGAGRVPVGFDVGQTEFDTDEETGGAKTVSAAGSNSVPTFTGTTNQNTSAITAGTPAGTNSVPTFTGAAMATHAHELPFSDTAGTGASSHSRVAQTVFGSGTSRLHEATDPTAYVTAGAPTRAVALSQGVSAGTPSGTVSAPTFTGNALGTHQHTLTPAGTVSAPTFTGSPTSVLSPYIVVRMWKRTA